MSLGLPGHQKDCYLGQMAIPGGWVIGRGLEELCARYDGQETDGAGLITYLVQYKRPHTGQRFILPHEFDIVKRRLQQSESVAIDLLALPDEVLFGSESSIARDRESQKCLTQNRRRIRHIDRVVQHYRCASGLAWQLG
jgi:hypothetical protein